MTWNNPPKEKEEKKGKDNFWMGFVPSFILPIVFIIIIFKTKYTTTRPIFEAMWKFSHTGLMGKDMISALIPSLVLFFVFYMWQKENACKGVFVGMIPFLLLTFLAF
jgi:hypothetical protein